MVFVNPQIYCTLLCRLGSPSRLVQSAKNRTINLTDWTHTMTFFHITTLQVYNKIIFNFLHHLVFQHTFVSTTFLTPYGHSSWLRR